MTEVNKKVMINKKNKKAFLSKKKLHYIHLRRKKLQKIRDKKLQNFKKNIKKISIKDKLLNYLLSKGNKRTSEKILLKSVKELQRCSKKPSLDIIKTAISLSVPIFRIQTLTDKRKKRKKKSNKIKRIPVFLTNKESRKSLALKFITKTRDKKKHNKMHLWLTNEFILNAKNEGSAVQIKYDIHKEAIKYKNIIKHYHWKI